MIDSVFQCRRLFRFTGRANDKVKRKSDSDLAAHSDRKPTLVHRQPSLGNLTEQDCLSSFMHETIQVQLSVLLDVLREAGVAPSESIVRFAELGQSSRNP